MNGGRGFINMILLNGHTSHSPGCSLRLGPGERLACASVQRIRRPFSELSRPLCERHNTTLAVFGTKAQNAQRNIPQNYRGWEDGSVSNTLAIPL